MRRYLGSLLVLAFGLSLLVAAKGGAAAQAPSTPGDVATFEAQAGSEEVELVWDAAPANDPSFKEFILERWTKVDVEAVSDPFEQELTIEREIGVVVYRGTGTTFHDDNVSNGVEYRYVLYVEDTAGNRSAGKSVLATPYGFSLIRPRLEEKLRKPPVFRWRLVAGATYYNVQLFRVSRAPAAEFNGKEATLVKVLSVWPVQPRYDLPPRWTFVGKRFALQPGDYKWFVWPGFDLKSLADYGPLLGASDFTVVGGVLGGATFQRLVGTRRADRLWGSGATDHLVGKGGNDFLFGRRGRDSLFGGSGNDRLTGGRDADYLTGGTGRDRLIGGAGSDHIFARDGEQDVVNCGGGHDQVVADRIDLVKRNCEVVTIRSLSGKGA